MIEAKDSVKAKLGKSPHIAEAIMLALGEPSYEPYRYEGLPRLPTKSPWSPRPSSTPATCQRQDDLDDAVGGPTFFVTGGQAQMHGYAVSEFAGPRWSSLRGRKCW